MSAFNDLAKRFYEVGLNGAFGLASFGIAVGDFPRIVEYSKFGRNSDIDPASDPEDIWNGGGLYTGFPDGAAETIEIFSDDTNDTSAGTGLRTIRLFGLLDGVEQIEDVTLNGTTPVVTTKQWDRMNRMVGLTAGSNGENVGEITARHTTTTANVFAVMPTGNRTQICAFTIPNGQTGYIKEFSGRITRANGAAGSASIAIMIREPGGLWQQRETYEVGTDSPAEPDIDFTIELPAGSDVVARVLQVSDMNTIATGHFVYRCISDE